MHPPGRRESCRQTAAVQTCVLLDWDDTLIPTSWLREHGDEVESPAVQAKLQAIAQLACRVLDTALAAGPTFIITNAKGTWVEHSAQQWAPALIPYLHQVEVISARERYECVYPGDLSRWKAEAFLDVRRSLDPEAMINLLVLGDAEHEMDAAELMGRSLTSAMIKTIRFSLTPTPMDLSNQLELVARNMQDILDRASNLKVYLEKPNCEHPARRSLN